MVGCWPGAPCGLAVRGTEAQRGLVPRDPPAGLLGVGGGGRVCPRWVGSEGAVGATYRVVVPVPERVPHGLPVSGPC